MKIVEIARLLCENMSPELIRRRDDFGRTALHYSASNRSTVVAHILLKKDHTLAYLRDKDGWTPLYIAATLQLWGAVNLILRYCPDCGELRDLKGQNVFHLLMAQRKFSGLLKLMKHPELKGLLSESDSDGNTLLHLAAKAHYIPALSFLLQCEGMKLGFQNKDGITALDLLEDWKPITRKHILLKRKYEGLLGAIHDGRRRLGSAGSGTMHGDAGAGADADAGAGAVAGVDEKRNLANTLVVVAALFATITFSAVFQPPGGYSSDPLYPGVPLHGQRAAFKVFLFFDALAFCVSVLSVIWLAWGLIARNKRVLPCMVVVAMVLLFVTFTATMLAFTSAFYLVTESNSKGLAVLILVMGCSAPLLDRIMWRWGPLTWLRAILIARLVQLRS